MKKLLFSFLVLMVTSLWMMGGCTAPKVDEEVKTEVTVSDSGEKSPEVVADASEPKPEVKPEPRPEPKPEPRPEPRPEPNPEPKQEPSPERKQDPEPTPDDGGSEVVPEDGGTGDVVPEKVQPPHPCKIFDYPGGVFDFFAPKNPPVEGVNVCILGTTNCTKTDKNGRFRLNKLSLNAVTYVTFKKTGWESLLLPLQVPGQVLNKNCELDHRVGLLSKQISGVIGTLLGTPRDPKKSIIVADVHDAKLNSSAGVKVALKPVKGNGPFYITPQGMKHTKQETSSAGIGIFLNLPAGSYDVSYSHATKKCGAFPITVRDAKGTVSRMTIPATGGPWMVVTSGLCQ